MSFFIYGYNYSARNIGTVERSSRINDRTYGKLRFGSFWWTIRDLSLFAHKIGSFVKEFTQFPKNQSAFVILNKKKQANLKRFFAVKSSNMNHIDNIYQRNLLIANHSVNIWVIEVDNKSQVHMWRSNPSGRYRINKLFTTMKLIVSHSDKNLNSSTLIKKRTN